MRGSYFWRTLREHLPSKRLQRLDLRQQQHFHIVEQLVVHRLFYGGIHPNAFRLHLQFEFVDQHGLQDEMRRSGLQICVSTYIP
jgi:hypothetical protein